MQILNLKTCKTENNHRSLVQLSIALGHANCDGSEEANTIVWRDSSIKTCGAFNSSTGPEKTEKSALLSNIVALYSHYNSISPVFSHTHTHAL